MTDWKDTIRAEWDRRQKGRQSGEAFPLMNQGFDSREIIAAVDSLLSGQLTMSQRVRELEQRFAEMVGSPFAVMVNSGSSANLLSIAAATNPARSKHLVRGDEVLVPAVCWSTTIAPLLQLGLIPVFVDVDPLTLNISIPDLSRKISPKTRALLVVHVLGNGCPFHDLLDIVEANDLILIEDTCESLGAKYGTSFLGTHGDFGTFSFYYSHHITTGEGGMITCRTLEDLDLIRCLRAHGWTRELSRREEIESHYGDIDSRFLFVNAGFSVRPIEVQAAIGLCQIARLGEMNVVRNRNRERLIVTLRRHPDWQEQLSFIEPGEGIEPAWFGFAALLSGSRSLKEYLEKLSRSGVENRPIISGNFTRQPMLELFGLQEDPKEFPGAEAIHERGFFIGLHSVELDDEILRKLADMLLGS